MNDGRQKWHTPTLAGIEYVIRCMRVPVEMLSYTGWAIGELTKHYHWLEVGSPIDDVIATAQEMLDSWYEPDLIGALMPFAGTLPAGWLPLDGSTLSAGDYPELAAVVPAGWLSGGGANIDLPDMAGRGVIGAGAGYTMGSVGGEAEHTLTDAEMPSHSHTYTPPILNLDLESPGAPDILAAGIGSATATSTAGSGDPHNNMSPFLAVTWAIFAGRL
jgi:microcystin-dependent protein